MGKMKDDIDYVMKLMMYDVHVRNVRLTPSYYA